MFTLEPKKMVLNDVPVTKIEVRPGTFAGFVSAWVENSGGKKASVAVNRARVVQQTTFYSGEDVIKVDPFDLSDIPVDVARLLFKEINRDPEGTVAPELLSGDGVSTPMLVKLGVPITMSVDKKQVEVSELEFFAKTLQDIEEIVAAPDDMSAVLAMLESLANPVAINTLTRLPSWAVNQVSIPDGLFMLNKVLPAF